MLDCYRGVDSVIFAGEVQTGWLRSSTAVDQAMAESLVDLKTGERVHAGTRPVRYTVSPDLLTGLHCQLAADKEVHGVGTAVSRAILTDGHVLQGSSHVKVVRSAAGRRMPWAHYMAQPGVVETISNADDEALANGFLGAPDAPTTMDLGAINDRLLNRIQRFEDLDGRVPFKTIRVRMRWIARDAKVGTPTFRFTLPRQGIRSLTMRLPETDARSVVTLCEEIALHEWLLTCLEKRLDESGTAPRDDLVSWFAPTVQSLLHLWMPGARLDDEMRAAWRDLDDACGFTRQWSVLSQKVRDELTLIAARKSMVQAPSTLG